MVSTPPLQQSHSVTNVQRSLRLASHPTEVSVHRGNFVFTILNDNLKLNTRPECLQFVESYSGSFEIELGAQGKVTYGRGAGRSQTTTEHRICRGTGNQPVLPLEWLRAVVRACIEKTDYLIPAELMPPTPSR